MKWHFIALTLLINSCSHFGEGHKRSVASISDDPCNSWMKTIVVPSETEKLDEDLQRYLGKRMKSYWGWHDNVSTWRIPAERLTRIRRVWLKWFQSLNANPVPLFYIGDETSTMASIIKFEGHFKKSKVSDVDADAAKEAEAVAEARDSYQKWVSSYLKYPERLINKSREFFVTEYAIKDLEKQMKDIKAELGSRSTFVREIRYDSMDFIDEQKPELGKYFKVEKFIARDTADIEAVIRDLKRLRETIVSKVIRVGSRREIVLKQAKDRKRLEMLYHKLLNLKLTNEANDFENDIEHLVMLENLDELLNNRVDLIPSENIVMRLEFREAWKETKGLFQKLTESKFTEKLKAIYDTLTPEEKRELGLDNRGISGAMINFVSQNKYWILGTGLLTGTGTAYSNREEVKETTRLWLDFITSDRTKRLKCINETTKKGAFENCMFNYLHNKYASEDPIDYSKTGIKGLIDSLKSDEKFANEIKEILAEIEEERAKKLIKDSAEEEAWIEFITELNNAIKDRVEGAGFQMKPKPGTSIRPTTTPISPLPIFNP